LQKYRPSDPPSGLPSAISGRLDNLEIGQSRNSQVANGRTWPWVFAASVLLAVVIALHGRTQGGEVTNALNDKRAQAILDGLDDTPEAATVASWIAHREAIAERQLQNLRMVVPPDQDQEWR
jgi:hypothetical protein